MFESYNTKEKKKKRAHMDESKYKKRKLTKEEK